MADADRMEAAEDPRTEDPEENVSAAANSGISSEIALSRLSFNGQEFDKWFPAKVKELRKRHKGASQKPIVLQDFPSDPEDLELDNVPAAFQHMIAQQWIRIGNFLMYDARVPLGDKLDVIITWAHSVQDICTMNFTVNVLEVSDEDTTSYSAHTH